MTTQELIAYGIAAARHENREIDDVTARAIASSFHDGSAIALAFVSTGTIAPNATECWRAFGDTYSTHDAADRLALDWFGTYLLNRESKDAVPGWQDLSW